MATSNARSHRVGSDKVITVACTCTVMVHDDVHGIKKQGHAYRPTDTYLSLDPSETEENKCRFCPGSFSIVYSISYERPVSLLSTSLQIWCVMEGHKIRSRADTMNERLILSLVLLSVCKPYSIKG